MQTDLLLGMVADARRVLDELSPHASQLRLDCAIGPAIAKGFEFRVTGGADRMTKEAFEDVALSIGTVLKLWLPSKLPDNCRVWDRPEFVFYEAIMQWSRTRGEGASGDVYHRSLYEPARAAQGLLQLMRSELMLAQLCSAFEQKTEAGSAHSSQVPDDLISHVDAAGIVGCSEQTIRNRIADGTLTAYGSLRRVSRRDVEVKKLSLLQRSHTRPKKSKKRKPSSPPVAR